MIITFLGTRGYIDSRTKKHYRHTSTMVEYHRKKIMVDCGLDWTEKVWEIKPNAIVITHAHPDHVWGLKKGSPCPVYAAASTWNIIKDYPIRDKFTLVPYERNKIYDFSFETFPVEHSLIAPAVGYRIQAGRSIIFCVHDLIAIEERHRALNKVKLYIGDGATIVLPMVRRRGDKLFGHTTVRAQLGWCQKENVPNMIVTHCGEQIVSGGNKNENMIYEIARERAVNVTIAYDGMKIRV